MTVSERRTSRTLDIGSLVKTADRVRELRAEVADLLQRLSRHEETLGVAILGGTAAGGTRVFADEVSDVDISLLISVNLPADVLSLPWPQFINSVQPRLPQWLPNFKFVARAGPEINIHQHIFEYESQPWIVWDNEKCEAYAETLEVVYDPHGCLARLVADKTSCRDRRAMDSMLWLVTYGRNLVGFGARKCLQRGRPDAANDILVRVAYAAVEAIFFLHGIWPPHHKWRLIMLEALCQQEPRRTDYYDMVAELLRQPGASAESCDSRRLALLELIDRIEADAQSLFDEWPSDPYGYAVAQFFPDRQLLITTRADLVVGPELPYAERMKDSTWNMINTGLTS